MPSDNTAFVGSIPENYDRYLGPAMFDPYAADLVARLKVPESASVLELACGTGIVSKRLRARLGPASKLVATDLNQAMLDYARAKIGAEAAIEWKQADATELPLPDEAFDAVVCQFGLMFFPDKQKAVGEVFRVLKPGGTFLFNVWDKIENNEPAHIAATIIKQSFAHDPPTFYEIPFSFHDPVAIESLLRAASFRDVQISLLPLAAISPSAQELAKGLINGNPVVTAIEERKEVSVAGVENAVAAAIAAQHGAAPVKARIQALICSARK